MDLGNEKHLQSTRSMRHIVTFVTIALSYFFPNLGFLASDGLLLSHIFAFGVAGKNVEAL